MEFYTINELQNLGDNFTFNIFKSILQMHKYSKNHQMAMKTDTGLGHQCKCLIDSYFKLVNIYDFSKKQCT